MAEESLDQFLVKIGWDVDELGFKDASKLTDSLFDKITKNSGDTTKKLISGGRKVLDMISSITSAVVSLIGKTAELDLKTERWARQYWTTEKNARSLQSAMKATGISSLDDLYYATNEEYSRFLGLRSFAKSLEAPDEVDDFLVKIRDIRYEISRLKVIFQYGARWITYYIARMFGKDTEELLNDFRKAVDWLGSNVPRISKKIVQFISPVLNIVKFAYKTGKAIYEFIVDVLDKIPSKTKSSLANLSTIILAFVGGPMGSLFAIMRLLYLLIDDYEVWARGGKSLFDWSGLVNVVDKIKSSKIADLLSDVLNITGDLFGVIKDICTLLGLDDLANSTVTLLLNIISEGLDIIDEKVEKLHSFLQDIHDWLSGDKKIVDVVNRLFGVEQQEPTTYYDEKLGKEIKVYDMTKDPLVERLENSYGGIMDRIANLFDEGSFMRLLLSGPTKASGSVVDNSNTEVNVNISHDKSNDTYEVVSDINRNTNYNSPIVVR